MIAKLKLFLVLVLLGLTFSAEFGGNRLFLIGNASWRNYNLPISLTWE